MALARNTSRAGSAYVRLRLVRVYLLTNEPAKALDALDAPDVLLKLDSGHSSGWLRLDPTFDPIRNETLLQKPVASR
jgi:hypothetical protein